MARRTTNGKLDVIVIGGGFYGCCLALFLRSVFQRVTLLEARPELLSRASLVNQARIHTGFHYPRSFATARRSLALYPRFVRDFRDAVVDDFTMLYAIARHGSKITTHRFERMFQDLHAPLSPASSAERSLFDPAHIAGVYRCREFAFDARVLRDLLAERMTAAGIDLRLGSRADGIETQAAEIRVRTGGETLSAPMVIDATYGQMAAEGGPSAPAQPLKYELTEIALVTPPAALEGLGVTVMDGPFFSIMPFPARDCYSLTHVRYTPHRAWVSGNGPFDDEAPQQGHWLHMQRDAARYMPCMVDLSWQGSLYETKTVLLRNERDDGRPILLSRSPGSAGLITVLGGKLDNIYDLFEALRGFGGPMAQADATWLCGDAEAAQGGMS